MKKLLIILIIFSNYTYAQSEIENLEKAKSLLIEERTQINDSIEKIELAIIKIESEHFSKQISNSSLVAIVRKGAQLKRSPDIFGEVILTLKDDQIATILDFHNEYFGICTDSDCGYLSEVWIKKNDKINNYIDIRRAEQKELDRIAKERELMQNEADRITLEKSYIKKYGAETYAKLKEGRRWLGMTKEMAIIAFGYPISDNRSVGSWGVHNQWVYDNMNLYFEDGVLASWQD